MENGAKTLPVEKTGFLRNLILYYMGIGVIVLGYIFLSIGGANSFTSLTLGPVVLVVGYLFAMPIALLTGVNRKAPLLPDSERTESAPVSAKPVKKA